MIKKVIIVSGLLIAISLGWYFNQKCEEKPMVVIIPSYNNWEYFEGNLDSILEQKYRNFRVIYLDDCSNDGMSELLDSYIRGKNIDSITIDFESTDAETIQEATERFKVEVNKEKHFFTLVHNKNRVGALANIYRAVMSTESLDVIILVDGDDRLFDKNVLTRVLEAYSSRNEVWVTHGTLIEYPTGAKTWCEPVPKKLIKKNAFREFKCPSHLRTFYSGLFKKIKLEDLLYEGKFFQMAWDMAIMFPLCEMAGPRHAYLKKPNYHYNIENCINDNKVDPQYQRDLDRYIRNMPRYQMLNGGF